MTTERTLMEFSKDHPECDRRWAPKSDNKYGLPLDPSGAYTYFKWLGARTPQNFDQAEQECATLVERFGKAVTVGRIGAWDQAKNDMV